MADDVVGEFPTFSVDEMDSTDSQAPTESQAQGDGSTPLGSTPPESLADPEQQVSRKRCREPSIVWEHFTKIDGSDPNDPKAECKHCKKRYCCHPKRNGTSALLAHINFGCKKYPFRRGMVDKTQTSLSYKVLKGGEGDSATSSLVVAKFSVERIRMGLARMIIMDELPFRFVEGQGFQEFIALIEPRFPIPSRISVGRDCYKLYLSEKDKLKKQLIKMQRISFTTDTWTSVQNFNYLCLTAHYIDDDWNLHKKILNFCPVPNHKGETIGRVIESCFLEWGIERIFTITVDNASSNDVAFEFLRRKAKYWEGSILSCEFLHVRCCAHILNLIVTDGLKDMHESILKVRNAVRYVKSSPARLEKFKACVENEKIQSKSLVCLDVQTRWNSTYLMLDVAEKFEKAFTRMEEDDGQYSRYFDDDGYGRKPLGPPRLSDWDIVRVFTKFLKVFYEVTLNLSGSSVVTSNQFFQQIVMIKSKLNAMCNDSDSLLKNMARSMTSKYDKYWGDTEKMNMLLFVAVVLDPRYKLKYVKFWFRQWYEERQAEDLGAKVRDTLIRLFGHYNNKSSEVLGSGQSKSSPSTPQECSDSEEFFMHITNMYKQHLAEEGGSECQSEVDQYLLDDCEDPSCKKFDILNWWRANSTKYRVLSMVARDVLAIPVSTVASESVFSTGGRVLDPFRSSLSTKTVQGLICTQNWLKSAPTPVEVREVMDELESYQIESDVSSASRSGVTTIVMED